MSLDVAYAGVNYAEVLLRSGVVPGLELPFTPGIETSRHVRAVGEGIAGLYWAAGRRPRHRGRRGYAEVAVAPALLVEPLLDGVPLTTGAAFPANATTAYLVLREVAHLTPGETVVVHAAAGGVGSSLGQTARSLGAGTVVGVVGSLAKIEPTGRLGYDHDVLSDEFEAGRRRRHRWPGSGRRGRPGRPGRAPSQPGPRLPPVHRNYPDRLGARTLLRWGYGRQVNSVQDTVAVAP